MQNIPEKLIGGRLSIDQLIEYLPVLDVPQRPPLLGTGLTPDPCVMIGIQHR
jgi:hypothetical protein